MSNEQWHRDQALGEKLAQEAKDRELAEQKLNKQNAELLETIFMLAKQQASCKCAVCVFLRAIEEERAQTKHTQTNTAPVVCPNCSCFAHSHCQDPWHKT